MACQFNRKILPSILPFLLSQYILNNLFSDVFFPLLLPFLIASQHLFEARNPSAFEYILM